MTNNLFDEEFLKGFIITLFSTAVAIIAGIITFVKQKNIDRRKKSEQNNAIFTYYTILLNRIKLSIPQEKINYKKFIDHINENWDSQPILYILGLEDKKRFHTEINQIDLFKAVIDKIRLNSEIIKSYLSIYTYVDSYKLKSELIIGEIQKGINENLRLRKIFLKQQRDLQSLIFIHLNRLSKSEFDTFNLALKDFHEKDLSAVGIIEVGKFYYNSIVPIKSVVEQNLKNDFAAQILPILNEFVFIIVDLKSIANEMTKFVNEYITELEILEKLFIRETDKILKYVT